MNAHRYADWDAGYVLGALAPDERHEYEDHLESCSTCAAAVAELSGLPGVLARLDQATAVAIGELADEPADAPRPSPDAVPMLARRVRATRRRHRSIAAIAVAAALVLGAGIGAVVPHALGPAERTETLQPVAGSGLHAQLAVASVPWGTELTWSCDYARAAGAPSAPYPAVEYSLVVTTASGHAETVATWTSGRADVHDLTAATHLRAADIRRVDIRVAGSSQPLAAAAL